MKKRKILHYLLTTIITLVFLSTNPMNGFSANTHEPSSPASKLIDKPFYEAVANSHQLADRLQMQLSGVTTLPGDMATIWRQTAKGHSKAYPVLLILQICVVILARSATIMKKSGADEATLLAITGMIIASSATMLTIMIIGCRRQVPDAEHFSCSCVSSS